jgi:hypothetical protein
MICHNPRCGIEFEPKHAPKKYCSAKCHSRARQNIYNKKAALLYPKRFIYTRAKQRADELHREFTITQADIEDIPETCPVFPWIRLALPTGKGRGDYPNGPSIDRIDSSRGYVPGNVRIISKRANLLKSDGTLREFEALVRDLKSRE